MTSPPVYEKARTFGVRVFFFPNNAEFPPVAGILLPWPRKSVYWERVFMTDIFVGSGDDPDSRDRVAAAP